MVCKPDNKTVFQEEEFYTAHCEVCNCWVKIYKFRGCEDRHQALEGKGVDVFREVRELEKIANYQLGQQPLPSDVKKSNKNDKPAKPSRRGR